jgi:Ca2+-binding EF-hand superfamily protein
MIAFMNTLDIFKSDMNELRKQFEAADTNMDGTLSREELRQILDKDD